MAASATDHERAVILVSALIVRDARLLLCTADDGCVLPSVLLEDGEELEEALARLLGAGLGLEDWNEEFLDTFYEPGGTGRLIRNVYVVEALPSAPEMASDAALHWVEERDLDEIGAGEALRSVLRQAGVFGGAPDSAGVAPIYIVTGPPAAGKSTVADLLSGSFARTAHVELDALQHMVRSGGASPVPGLADPVAAAEQIELALANAAALAVNFARHGFHTVIDGVLETPEQLDVLLAQFEGLAEVYFVTLLPGGETLVRRDSQRDAGRRMGARALEIRQILEANGEWRGLRLDTSQQTAAETVRQILGHRALARVF